MRLKKEHTVFQKVSDITFDERQIEIPARLAMPIGKDRPGDKD